MSKEERDKQSVSQDISDAADAKLTGELSEQDLAKVDGGGYTVEVVDRDGMRRRIPNYELPTKK